MRWNVGGSGATSPSGKAASATNKPVSRINAIGLIDYSRTPTFKVGDWVRYHMTSKSDLGLSDADVAVLQRVVLIGMGTSLHSAMIGRTYIEQLTGLPAEVDNASEYRYRRPIMDEHTLIVAITQAGETVDTLAAMHEAREKGAKVIAICNTPGSQATRVAHGTVFMRCGPEVAVAATKTFLGALTGLYLFACHLGERRGHGDDLASIDGHRLEADRERVAEGEGVRTRITGPEAEREAHRLRSGFDAIMVGEGTVRADDPRLTVRSIKLYVDGALGSRGAALDEPYSDAPDSRGLYVTQPEEILRIATAALHRGIQVETHAIGDRGNHVVLDLYEQAFAAVSSDQRPVGEPRFRIEHAQVLDDVDLSRFAKLGVIASMQASHAISDMLFAPARLGPDRIGGAYAWRKLLDAGATIAGGTDAPVEAGDPRVEFYAAVARRTLEGFAGPDWGLDQRLTRAEALAILTRSPAFAAFQEPERGSIEPGRLADFSVFSADWMEIPEGEIPRSEAVMTVIGGRIAWQAPAAK